MSRPLSRILTTHVGSLPRPEALDDALAAPSARAEDADFANLLAQKVADVVARQAALGIDIVNDGEFGKSSWTGYLTERLGGFEARPVSPGQSPLAGGKDRADFPEFYAYATRTDTLWYRPDRPPARQRSAANAVGVHRSHCLHRSGSAAA